MYDDIFMLCHVVYKNKYRQYIFILSCRNFNDIDISFDNTADGSITQYTITFAQINTIFYLFLLNSRYYT